MYLFECEATLQAEPAAVWAVWTDVARWPEWDVSKEIARLDGPFQPGVSGWAKQRGNLGGSFTITAVDAGRRWVTECPMPLGKVVFDHVLEPVAGGRVRVVKRVEVQGGIAPLVRLFAPKMRRDIVESLAASRGGASSSTSLPGARSLIPVQIRCDKAARPISTTHQDRSARPFTFPGPTRQDHPLRPDVLSRTKLVRSRR